MMMKNLFFLLLCFVALVSCENATVEEIAPDPVIINSLANFEITKDPTDAFKYNFKNLSKDYTRVEWRFGDDTLTTVIDPSHTYLGTGDFDIELKTFSETGTVSRKVVKINIHPDSVMKITYDKTGVPDELQLGIESKANIKSVLWTFGDLAPAGTSTLINPVKKYVSGRLNTITAKITTVNGSVASITKNNMTSQGLVGDATKEIESFTVSAENNGSAAESSKSIFDNNVETKFLLGGNANRAFTWPIVITANYATAQTIKIYAIGNANDSPNRDPKDWTIQGSNDGVNWEILDTRSMAKNFYNQKVDEGINDDTKRYKQLFYFGIANPKPFTKYKLVITANYNDALMQFSGWSLYK
ncbi:MAG: hypothetical protein EOO92_00610 [Pedobacter sp.]|nr:MAG: hypothetical protein EOO92_00610 [Pedobacter sp.]